MGTMPRFRAFHPAAIKQTPLFPQRKAFHHKALGIHKFYDPKYSLLHKFFWLFIVLFSVTLFLFHTTQRVMEFFAQPTRLQLILEEKAKVNLPPLGLCSGALNAYVKDVNTGVIQEEKISRYDQLYYTLAVDTELISVKKQCYKLSNTDSSECDYQPVEGNLKTKYVSTLYGRCITLESKPSTNTMGPSTSLTFRWNISDNEKKYFGNQKRRFYYYLVNPTWTPNHSVLLLSERAEMGKAYSVRVSARIFRFQNNVKHPCTGNSWKARRCITQCTNEMVEKKVDCRLPFMESSDHASCKTLKQIITTLDNITKIYRKQNPKRCNCSDACNFISYRMSMDSAIDLDNDTAGLTLLYSDDTEEIMQEELAYSQSALLSDIGGALGLYLGVSVITIFDFADWFIQTVLAGQLNYH